MDKVVAILPTIIKGIASMLLMCFFLLRLTKPKMTILGVVLWIVIM